MVENNIKISHKMESKDWFSKEKILLSMGNKTTSQMKSD